MDNYQKQLYESHAKKYGQHYFDTWSMRYRREFIYPALWGEIDFKSKRVVELACGAGDNSLELSSRFDKVSLTGLDISPSACASYGEKTGGQAFEVDLTKPLTMEFEPFDAAFVIGGLHHCVADLETTLKNISVLVKPGGKFMMLEPNKRFFLEAVRKVWYGLDPSFDAGNEAALDHDEIYQICRNWFESDSVRYLGGPAFFTVLNSMVLRIPLSVKPILSPPMMALERVWNRIPLPICQNVFAATWTRK
jgi:ubiquinone/menaquinone biosynthesis C-methylase UbiE